jgi:xylan 1,4-beta-xylosidase
VKHFMQPLKSVFFTATILIISMMPHYSMASVPQQPSDDIVNPVLPGDRPDPTVIKIGDSYWATATSNEWSPLFPIFKSDNLVDWELVSYVFPEGAPAWTINNFWAPELAYDEEQDKTYVYYTARSKDHNRLSVAVASADSPEGPYTDHGPLVSQVPGSIDAFEFKDEDGTIYLSWKEDGNSMGRPTHMWLQEINAERTELIGEPVVMFNNEDPKAKDWERGLVEGICIFKEGDYYYATYSGGGCCDVNCNYKTGVARTKSLKGPWERNPANPILVDNEHWKCPGHGTVVKKDGEHYMLYHAYNQKSHVYVGREGVLEKLYWNDEDWPYFKNDASYDRKVESLDFYDDFKGKNLNSAWLWRVTHDISFKLKRKALNLKASRENEKIGSMLVREIAFKEITRVLAFLVQGKALSLLT